MTSTVWPNSGRAVNQFSSERSRATVADDHDGRRAEFSGAQMFLDAAEGREDRLLIGERATADDGDRRVGALAMGDQIAAPLGRGGESHVEDERAGKVGERGIVERFVARLVAALLAGDEGDARSVVAIGERDAGMAAGGLRRRDAGNDFVRNAGRFEGGKFFGEPGEDGRVAPFEPHHGPPRAGLADQAFVDLGLRQQPTVRGLCVAVPTEANELGVGARAIEQLGSGEIVVEHDVGRAEAFGTAQRKQPGVARTGADEVDCAVVCGHAICYGESWLASMTFST